jgi:ribonuclease HI
MEKVIRIYTDGASRGNPGPGAIAYIITDESGNVLRQSAKFIGACTNNIAEYSALILALEDAMKLGSEAFCFSDSELVVSQLQGKYKVKKGHIKELFERVKTIEKNFSKIEYNSVRRTDAMIRKADDMVNAVLDNVEKLQAIKRK